MALFYRFPTHRRTGRRSQRALQLESLESRELLTVNAVAIDAMSGHVGNHQALVPRIVNGHATSSFDSVGIVNDGCTGTLIGDRFVLTAAHCVEGVADRQGTFEVNGQTYDTTKVTSHPQYRPSTFADGYDIAVMELDRAVVGVTPSEILRQTPTVGQTLTLVGFGEGGTTTGGSLYDFGTLRVGQTPIDEVTDFHVSWSLDNHHESNTAPGDSGGPAFINIDGQSFIAGVTSGGDGDSHQLGDFSFDTRVDTFAAWIDSLVGGSNSGGGTNPGGTNPGGTNPGGTNPGGNDPGGATSSTIEIVDGFGFTDATLQSSQDVDRFVFSIEDASWVEIDLFSWDGDIDTRLTLSDSRGHVIASNDDAFGSTDSFVDAELSAGIYSITVSGALFGESGEYGLDVYVDAVADGWESSDGGSFDDSGFDDSGFDDSGFDDGGFDDSGFDDSGFDDSGFDDGAEPIDDGFGGADDWLTDVDGGADVDGDGMTTPLDALQIITYLMNHGMTQVGSGDVASGMDVDGDGAVTPMDVMSVINALFDHTFARSSSLAIDAPAASASRDGGWYLGDDPFEHDERWY